jgi:hypothetical protein
MATSNKLTLERFVKRYSEANQTPMDIVEAAVAKLDHKSGAYEPAKRCLESWNELLEILEASGFEL